MATKSHFSSADDSQMARARDLADDLLEVVGGEHATQAISQMHIQQPMELHHAQMQFSFSGPMAVRALSPALPSMHGLPLFAERSHSDFRRVGMYAPPAPYGTPPAAPDQPPPPP
jgi:hypothetical protein